MKLRILPALTLLCILAGPARPAAEPVSVASLARRLTDMQALPLLESERVAMESSADITGDNEDWAHGTASATAVPLADLEGPGAITRLFFTGWENDQARLLVHVDGAAAPTLDIPFRALMDGTAPFGAAWSRLQDNALVCQLPIPFAKSIRVRVQADKLGRKFVYQIGHTRFPAGTPVTSFALPLDPAHRAALDQAERALAGNPAPPAEPAAWERSLEIAPGASVDLPEITGPGRIVELRAQATGASLTNALLRSRLGRDVVLSARWDGAEVGSIECPLGDFHGQPWRAARYASLAWGSDGSEWYNRLPMPFRSSARLALTNEGNAPHSLRVRVWARMGEQPGHAGYLHAGFQRSEPDDTGPEHPVLRILGDGRYVGTVLTFANRQDLWAGLEGDESVRVDEEQIPGWRGTALDHAFDSAGTHAGVRAGPFSGVLLRVPFKTVQYRLHALDAPRFRKSIDVQLERGGQNTSPVWMESASFAYLRRPQAADTLMYAPEARRPPRGNWDAATIMTDLACLEALGDVPGAIHRIEEFNANNPDLAANPYQPLLRLRREALVASLSGYGAVAAAVEAMRTTVTNADFRFYATEWAWLHAHPTNALVAVYANPPVEVFLDGQSIGRTSGRDNVRLFRAPLPAGRRVLAVECGTRTPDAPWLHVMVLRGGKPVVSSDALWRAAHDPSGDWRRSGFDDSGWLALDARLAPPPGPILPALSVVPHPVPGLHDRTLNVVRPVPADRAVTGYRRVFDVPPAP